MVLPSNEAGGDGDAGGDMRTHDEIGGDVVCVQQAMKSPDLFATQQANEETKQETLRGIGRLGAKGRE